MSKYGQFRSFQVSPGIWVATNVPPSRFPQPSYRSYPLALGLLLEEIDGARYRGDHVKRVDVSNALWDGLNRVHEDILFNRWQGIISPHDEPKLDFDRSLARYVYKIHGVTVSLSRDNLDEDLELL